MTLMAAKSDRVHAGGVAAPSPSAGRQTRLERDAADLTAAIAASKRAGELLLSGQADYALDQANLARGFLDEILTRNGRPIVKRPADDDSELGPKMRLKRRVAANQTKAKLMASRYERLKNAKLCVICGDEPALPGQVRGAACAAKRTEVREADRERERRVLGARRSKP